VLKKVQELQKLKLLFVEDEKDLIQIISETLSKLELNYLIGHNGQEGLDLLAQHNDVDIIITDLNMPIMNGVEMIEKIRSDSRYNNIEIIIMSAHTEKSIVDQIEKLGVKNYLYKPFDFIKFIDLIFEVKTKKEL